MPTYDFKCRCGHAWDELQGIHEEHAMDCPRCGGRTKALMSAPAVIFIGPGFYKNDSRPVEPFFKADREETMAIKEAEAAKEIDIAQELLRESSSA